ncbi:ABATE domain-containing protein [Kitasatospora sp. RG8]|uniref:CGNR zinc finger domain-containing protein n=1 Tax=Kitasatospora sp. RG8 TaxID=2820815 RepID=UPI001ADF2C8B|nr:ABATE domain-containing protein [Kitasatospora sp. RG8]MBP0453248.1 ABATE domain-containing protein [Kitasatospora sp. RG8]
MPRSTHATDPQLTFPFIGGRPCLNFVATLGRRHATPVERLPDPDALTRWFTEAGLHPDGAAAEATDRDLAQARRLREALYRLLRAAMTGHPPAADDLAEANTAAAAPDLAPQLAPADGGLRLHWHTGAPADGVRAALSAVARDAALLAGGPLLGRVKECESPDCSLLFLDDSQARRRRWCSMERCGNLAKVAGYRARTRP